MLEFFCKLNSEKILNVTSEQLRDTSKGKKFRMHLHDFKVIQITSQRKNNPRSPSATIYCSRRQMLLGRRGVSLKGDEVQANNLTVGLTGPTLKHMHNNSWNGVWCLGGKAVSLSKILCTSARRRFAELLTDVALTHNWRQTEAPSDAAEAPSDVMFIPWPSGE